MNIRPVSLAITFLGAAVSASAVDLVRNGGFEATDATGGYGAGWSSSSLQGFDSSSIFQNWTQFGFDAAPNSVSAFLGHTNGNVDTISQAIDTAGSTSGLLSLTFTSDGFDTVGYDFLKVSFGGVSLDTIDVGSSTGDRFTSTRTYNLAPYFDGTTKNLEISVALDRTAETWVWVDNVSIVTQAVPEPTTLAAFGLGAVAVLRRRRRT